MPIPNPSRPLRLPGLLLRAGFSLFLILSAATSPVSASSSLERIRHLIRKNDAVILSSARGEILFEANADAELIPASTLKIFTALAAFHSLGPDYRFPTEFYLGPKNTLKIKGYGDPVLVSENVAAIAAMLRSRLKSFADMELDDSYFRNTIRIPGVSASFQPYDAPNSALCVNFNTVNFKRTAKGGFVSAEKQTPLLPFVKKRIAAFSQQNGRIVLTNNGREATLYAGHLFKYFLEKEGVVSDGKIEIGRVQKNDQLLLVYTSPFTLKEVVKRLLEFSNNFIANQVLLACGAKIFGPPATLDKGVRAAIIYARRQLRLKDFSFVEGSGISRHNRISARTMLRVLNAFEPYHTEMRQDKYGFFKSGHLDGIETRVGYLTGGGGLYRFVVMANTPGTSVRSIMRQLHRHISSLSGTSG